MLETSETFPYSTELGNAGNQSALTPPVYACTSYNNNNDLINLEYDYKMPPAYTTENNSIPLNHSTQYARYLQYGIYWNGTDPTNNDTDRDGLKDGDELSISNPHNGIIENPYGNRYGTTLDPLNPDTDGDGIQDGQEYNGYTAVYFMQVGDTNKKLSRKITDADPFSAFKSKDGRWLDTDEDKIPDIIERDPANMTRDIFDNIQNIDNFRWYYNKYKNDENAKNANNDNNNENAKDAQDKITNQFNPNVVECIIPVTDNINVLTNSDVGWDHANAWTDITIDVRDTVGIKKVILEVTDCNRKVTLDIDDAEKLGDGWLRFKTTIDIDFWGDYLLDYTVKVKVIDLNGNSFVTEKKVNGVFGGIINAIVDAVKGFLEDAWEAAKGLVDGLWNWIKDLIQDALKPLIQPILDVYEAWASNVREALSEFSDLLGLSETENDDVNTVMSKVSENELKESNDNSEFLKNMAFTILLTSLFGGAFLGYITALAIGMTALEYILFGLSDILPGMGVLASFIANFVIGEFLKTLFTLTLYTVGGILIGEVIYTLLYTFLPEDNVFWGTTVGSMIAGSGVIILEYIKTGKSLSKLFKPFSGDGKDLLGFLLAIIGGFLAIGFENSGHSLLAAGLGLIFSVIGLTLALVPPESMVEKANKGIGYLDELIDGAIVGIAVGGVISEFD